RAAPPRELTSATLVQLGGGADQRDERLLVDLLSLVNVDRPPRVALQARVEQAGRIVERRALEERQLDDALVGLARADPAVVRPDRHSRVCRLAPLPLLDDLALGLRAQGAAPGERLAAPVAQLLDLRVDQLRWRLVRRHHAAIFWRTASTRAKPCFAPSSTPYCIVVSRCSAVSKSIVCVSFVCSPRSSNSSVCRWFWNVCTRRS